MAIDVVSILFCTAVFVLSALLFIDEQKWMTIMHAISRRDRRPSGETRGAALAIMLFTVYMIVEMVMDIRH